MACVPEICRFLGIVIRMYWLDHEPPHFHAQYGEYSAQLRIAPFGILRGHLPPRVLAAVAEWATLEEAGLLENWRRLHNKEAPLRLPPLE